MMDIVRPTLLLDEAKCRANIVRMSSKARKNGIVLRPHFKTHQSHLIGRWFREAGVHACTVSSVHMASYFAEDGWRDITVAFPLNALEHEAILRMSKSITLNLTAVNTEAIQLLHEKVKTNVGIFIEIDTGYTRSGALPSDHQTIDSIIESIESCGYTFRGFLSHSGQSYACRSKEELLSVHAKSVGLFKGLGDHYRRRFPDLQLSLGDTPTCSVAEKFDGLTEIRPGNFVFYDFMQTEIGSCSPEEVAAAMACPVVAVYPERREVIIHGGGVHFSKDSWKRKDGTTIFGQMVKLTENGWTMPAGSPYLRSISQEHGIILCSEEDIRQIKVGDVVGILPVHSCMTADVMGEYFTLDGKRIKMMPK